MHIPYKTFKITSPLSKEKTGKYYARFKSRGEVDLRNIAGMISDMSTISTPDMIAVIESIIELIPKLALDGYIVKLGDFGSFSISLKSEGVENEKDFTAGKIKKASLNYNPAIYIKKKLKNAKYKKI